MNKTFLVEIGTEELPPKSLKNIAENFAQLFTAELNHHNLAYDDVIWYASPRRIALHVKALADAAPDSMIEKRGPAVSAAFDADGNPTKAAIGWAKGCQIDVSEANRLKTDKGEWLFYEQKQQGQKVTTLLCEMVQNAISKLPIPKPMRWGDKQVEFIRPCHSVTMLYGDELIAGKILDINADRVILGHRFMGQQELTLDHADNYLSLLKNEGKVIANYDERKSLIKSEANKLAQKLGGRADISESLLDEVTSLVEWPVVLSAKFEERFLDVPAEALVHTMKGDQKYFPIYDENNKLLPYFIFVTNIESKDPSVIISGNEKVVRPRLSDAAFFYHSDLKQRLDSRLSKLDSVLFQQQLGTVKDKALRLEALSGFIASKMGAKESDAKRAGLLAKCDLVTNTVFEFPETQGVIGYYLALHDNEPAEVANSIKEQYKPKFAGDDLPSSLTACSVAIAEKLDTLAGIFGIGQFPKGDKDPFALRRAAIGILRIIIEKQLDVDLMNIITRSVSLYGDKLSNQNAVQDIADFMQGRYRAFYQEQGIFADTIQSVLACNPTRPLDFDARVKAVAHFRTLAEADSLAEVNKRASNILSKSGMNEVKAVNPDLFENDAERALSAKLTELNQTLTPYFESGDYQKALTLLATLKAPVDHFFDITKVMADDEAVKINRLMLLKQLQQLFLKVADISLLQ